MIKSIIHYTEITYTKANGDVVTRRSADDAYVNRLLGRIKNVHMVNKTATWEEYWNMDKEIIKKKGEAV